MFAKLVAHRKFLKIDSTWRLIPGSAVEEVSGATSLSTREETNCGHVL
jgi:hypothetical protein